MFTRRLVSSLESECFIYTCKFWVRLHLWHGTLIFDACFHVRRWGEKKWNRRLIWSNPDTVPESPKIALYWQFANILLAHIGMRVAAFLLQYLRSSLVSALMSIPFSKSSPVRFCYFQRTRARNRKRGVVNHRVFGTRSCSPCCWSRCSATISLRCWWKEDNINRSDNRHSSLE